MKNIIIREEFYKPKTCDKKNSAVFNEIFIGNTLKQKEENISNFIKSAVPLTLIAFKGRGSVSIRLTETIQINDGDFSHIGILINSDCCPFIPNLKKGKFYVWESTVGLGEIVFDSTRKKNKFGVKIRDLEELIPNYLENHNSSVAYCTLIYNPWEKKEAENFELISTRRRNIISTLEKVYKENHDKLYEINICQLLALGFPRLRKIQYKFGEYLIDGVNTITNMNFKERDDDFIFCSEFVTIVYQSLNIISSEFKPYEVFPIDFFGNDKDGIKRIVNNPIYFLK